MRIFLALMAAVDAFAQGTGAPAIAAAGIVNGASLLDPTVPGGALAQGSLFTITGSNLGPGSDIDSRTAVSASPPYPALLAGVSVRIERPGASLPAWLVSVWTNQISAILPSNTPEGEVRIVVTVHGKSSLPATAVVTRASFGILTGGSYPRTTPARPGQEVVIRGTGLGPIDIADNLPPGKVPLDTPIEIRVGDKVVTNVLYAGRTAELPGIDELIFQLPEDSPEGCFVPVQVRTGDRAYSNIATIAVDAEGAPCTDRLNPLARTVLTGGRVGLVELLRLYLHAILREGDAAADYPAIDLGEASFFRGTSDDPGLNPLYARPPVGSCIAAPAMSVLTALLMPGAYGKIMEAGPSVAVRGPYGEIELKSQTGFPGEYYALLGGRDVLRDNSPTLTPFLTGGTYTVTGEGGRDVGGFRTQATLAPELVWTNRNDIGDVDRAAGVTIEWSGGDPETQLAVIFGGAGSTATGGGFLCLADVTAGSFTVPPNVLATVPAVSAKEPMAGFLMLGALPMAEPPNTFAARGIDQGYVVSAAVHARQVGFR